MLDILADPTGETYRRLVRLAAQRCSTFSLVWRDEEYSQVAYAIEARLRPYLVREEHTKAWPGTELRWDTARVSHYEVNDFSRRILSEAISLYEWQAPDRPEDLAFYTADGSCWLGSIAHENDAFICATDVSIDDLHARIPGLKVAQHEPKETDRITDR